MSVISYGPTGLRKEITQLSFDSKVVAAQYVYEVLKNSKQLISVSTTITEHSKFAACCVTIAIDVSSDDIEEIKQIGLKEQQNI